MGVFSHGSNPRRTYALNVSRGRANPRGNPPGEIYGKAVESVAGTPPRVKIRFASVTPELKSWMLNARVG
jgi:hypothetical protein